ncbi:MAG: hypothetical protein V7609_3304 [Verrucomicrobiota bacterium]
MIKRNFTAALIAAGMLVIASVAQATVVDLGSSGSGTINGAIFQTNNDHPTGTGVYNPFLTIQNKDWEQGYNSSIGNFDTKREPQWNHEIRFSDLQATTIAGIQYFGFSVDINETNHTPLISLDALRVYTSSTLQSSTSTNGSGFFNGSLGTLRYDLGGNQVLYNDQNTGSGGGDINIYIPISFFAGTNANDYVYVYQRWGNTDSSDGGFEETALIRGLTPVPEMSALFPIVGLLVAVGSTHVLRRRRLARVSS